MEVEEEDPEQEVEVPLPDDSLADTDLHDHDLIDSVMYIYFGSSERDERGAGRQVSVNVNSVFLAVFANYYLYKL